MNHKPWDENHKPQRFERTDPTGRWSPILTDDTPLISSHLFLRILSFVAIAVVLILLYLVLHVDAVV